MQRLIKIQQGLRVKKDKNGDNGRFKYRSVEDVFENVKPLLGETQTAVVVSDELVEVGGKIAVKATATLNGIGDGNPIASATGYAFLDSHIVVGYAKDGQRYEKATMSQEQCTGSASSYARKYALCGLFAIDNGEEDPDGITKQEPEMPPKPAAKPATKPAAKPADKQPEAKKEDPKPAQYPDEYYDMLSDIESADTIAACIANITLAVGQPYLDEVRKAAVKRGINVATSKEEVKKIYGFIQDKPGWEEMKALANKVVAEKKLQ